MRNLFFHSMYACGTVHPNRRGLLPLLAIKWCEKRAVNILTTVHPAVHVETSKTDAQGNRILKPLALVDYIKKMGGGCDTSDQLISYYSFLQKSVKWWEKLFIHLLNMLLLNTHILNSKYGFKKLDHHGYMKYMVSYLITEGFVSCSLKNHQFDVTVHKMTHKVQLWWPLICIFLN